MNRWDTDRLFTLLAQFYPNGRVTETKKKAWALALEPYEYEAVKAAAVKYAAQNKYFPDLADLTGNLPQRGGKPTRDDSSLLAKKLGLNL